MPDLTAPRPMGTFDPFKPALVRDPTNEAVWEWPAGVTPAQWEQGQHRAELARATDRGLAAARRCHTAPAAAGRLPAVKRSPVEWRQKGALWEGFRDGQVIARVERDPVNGWQAHVGGEYTIWGSIERAKAEAEVAVHVTLFGKRP